MMRTLRLLALAGLGVLAAAACSSWPEHVVTGSGHARTESRHVRDFDQVALAAVGTLVITQGDTESLRIQADDNVLPLLHSTVSRGLLTLEPKEYAAIHPSTPIRYELTARQLRLIRVEGAAEAQAPRLIAEQLALEVEGAGRVGIDQLSAKALTASLEGSAGVTVGGQVAQQTLHVMGAGMYRGQGLESQRASVTVTGSGTCAVRAHDSLDARVEGSGVVTYSGSPTVTRHVTGSGQVTAAA
jgi:putative autotransporter adhesin-like protein